MHLPDKCCTPSNSSATSHIPSVAELSHVTKSRKDCVREPLIAYLGQFNEKTQRDVGFNLLTSSDLIGPTIQDHICNTLRRQWTARQGVATVWRGLP
ncbi:hypothetical protein Y032_0093g2646 [Ancylostoma ceylanicum]|uniref:Uncharacterized protein n=1 Tax=Ancylostoma ceylanicum TaxID=53326 RepID=A0A016TKS1_9BILA|nr:hypothetical protein Y032_0093g2646 [Ancylostoma ceylanicum]